MLEGKAVVRETDMPAQMQSHVMELAYQALDVHEPSDCQSIACYLKQLIKLRLVEQKFDEAYGPAWHCVVGKEFGSCVTHLLGSFIFFHVEMIEFLIFKDGNNFMESKEEAVGVMQKASQEKS
ncbi:RHO guanyl-nucleotide exchange factor 11 [Tripterygium wilfordii]|uniref:Dynein light chain n=1 Tax=Tripterygium wilfordii TaxID=458696 RepID=A0A7J7DXK2_TRIWF|nr:RHO guanyl-nucleotide exchange factor 11 [Tripterygium wilfordii]